MFSFSDIEKFTAQWKDTKVVSTNNSQSSNGKCFSRVSFCENESTVFSVLGSSIVRIRELGKAGKSKSRLCQMTGKRIRSGHTDCVWSHQSFWLVNQPLIWPNPEWSREFQISGLYHSQQKEHQTRKSSIHLSCKIRPKVWA